jgi:hypothetical protein
MKVHIRIEDHTKLTKIPPKDVITNFLDMSSEKLVGEVKKLTPVDKGKLRGSWTPKLSSYRLTLTNTRNYSIFVDRGTGIFGPRHHRIFAKKGSVMRAKIGGQTIFFKHHRGRPAVHMAERGLESYTYHIPNLFHKTIQSSY